MTLKDVDASKTTLVLAEPNFPTENSKQVQAEIADFLSRWRQRVGDRERRSLFSSRREDGGTDADLSEALLFYTGGTGATG